MNKLSFSNNEDVLALVKEALGKDYVALKASNSYLDELAVRLYRCHFDMEFCRNELRSMPSWYDGSRVFLCVYNSYKSHKQMCEAQGVAPDPAPDMVELAALLGRAFRDNPLQVRMDVRLLASALVEAWNRIEGLDDKIKGLEDKVQMMQTSAEGVQVSLTRARKRVDEGLADMSELKENAVDADSLMEDMFSAMLEGAQEYVDQHPERAPNVREFLRLVIPERYQGLMSRLVFSSRYSEINERTIPAERLAKARELLWKLSEDREVVELWMSRFWQQTSTPKMGRELLPEFKADPRLDFSKLTKAEQAEGISFCLSYKSGSPPSNVLKLL